MFMNEINCFFRLSVVCLSSEEIEILILYTVGLFKLSLVNPAVTFVNRIAIIDIA